MICSYQAARPAGSAPPTAAAAEAAALYKQLAALPVTRTSEGATLQSAVTDYLASKTFDLYKPLTQSQRRSQIKIALAIPASNGRHELADSLLVDWLHGGDAPDTVRRVMATCGAKAAQANHLRKALDQFFIWLASTAAGGRGSAALPGGQARH